MFGQNQPQQNDSQIPDQSIDAALGSDPEDVPAGAPTQPWQHPGQPINGTNNMAGTGTTIQPLSDTPSPSDDSATPAADEPAQTEEAAPEEVQAPAPVDAAPATDVVAPADAVAPETSANDLLDIKQQALGALSPLVDHLDQSPEEKFRTTMMMIQASDNQSLVRVAYEAAQQITDEKVRAQALLDVINEINYFTQNQTPGAPAA